MKMTFFNFFEISKNMFGAFITDKNKSLYDIYELMQQRENVPKISSNFTCCLCNNTLPLSNTLIHYNQCNIESTEKLIYDLRRFSKDHESLKHVELLSFIGLKDNKLDNVTICIINKYYQLYTICKHYSILHQVLNILTYFTLNLPIEVNNQYSHIPNMHHKKILSQLKQNIDKNVNDILFDIALREICIY